MSSTNRFFFFVVLCFVVSGCKTIKGEEHKNKPDHMLVRTIGPGSAAGITEEYKPVQLLRTQTVSSALKGVWQYGLLAEASYAEPGQQTAQLGSSCPYKSRYTERWRRLPEYSIEGFQWEKPSGKLTVPGYSYSVWVDQYANRPSKVAIVFRGTNFTEFGDWYSNLRWITKLNPVTLDQYDQTRNLVAELVPELVARFGSDLVVIAVGHSLGGGLAQHAGYSSEYVSTVYAFASSPVTGRFDFIQETDPRASENLEVFRLNESGEVMAGPRYLQRKLISPSSTKVVELLFSFKHAFYKRNGTDGPIGQHSMGALACSMICQIEHGLDDRVCSTTTSSDD